MIYIYNRTMSIYHRIFKINSRDSILGKDNVSRSQYAVNNPGSKSNIVRIVLKDASFKNTFYTITQYNNTFILDDGVSNVITIPIGNYNTTTLMTFLNANAFYIASGTVVTFDSLINKFITTSANNIQYTYDVNVTNAFEVLGLSLQNHNILAAVPFTHPYICDLSSISNVYIYASFAQMNSIDTRGLFSNLVGIVAVDVPFGSTIHYENDQSDLDQIDKNSSSSHTLSDTLIELKDMNGNLLDLQGTNYEMTFKVYKSH